MSDTDIPDTDTSHDTIHDGQGTYDVVLLVEQALSPVDAAQVRSLHAESEDLVVYHVLIPLEDAAARIEATLGTLAAAGGNANGRVTSEPPVDALAALVGAVDAREAIILTRPHVVAEFFHVDWTSRARRKLGVPVLHLIEHENFDEQASGSGEGVSGL